MRMKIGTMGRLSVRDETFCLRSGEANDNPTAKVERTMKFVVPVNEVLAFVLSSAIVSSACNTESDGPPGENGAAGSGAGNAGAPPGAGGVQVMSGAVGNGGSAGPGGVTSSGGIAPIGNGGSTSVGNGGGIPMGNGGGIPMAGAPSGGRGSAGVPGGGSAGAGAGAAGGSGCVQDLKCMPPAPNTGDIYADCVARVNQFRACVCLPPLQEWKDGEACANQDSMYDAQHQSDGAHAGFKAKICAAGNAQDECPGYRSNDQVISGCLQQMFNEGPPPMMPCSGTCYQQHGHFINMTNTRYTSIACGFFTNTDGKIWAVQNFK
jgi:hypothetical protein